ncbi:MAG: Dihydroorotase [Gammaproteobacteria bacterium]|nr:Dihydroorotase [Gammaproteobacteria bacterium]
MELTITRPDDWHVHLRDGGALSAVAPDTARQFARAIVMPNLKPPVVTVEQARAYRERIFAALPAGSDFRPLMTLYLTDNTPATEIARARDSGIVHAVKYYPAGTTTNSDSGVTDVTRVYRVIEAMQRCGLPLLVHGEVADPFVDVFDREMVFIEHVLAPLLEQFPGLKLVFEHVTTADAVEFVLSQPGNVAATITAHHLLLNRNAMFDGGIRPHHYCLPVLKREDHRQALLRAATGGSPKFFLGTDSAPHARHTKETVCGCAGLYTAHNALELYAEAFEQADALDRLEGFASFHGADFYGLPRNSGSVTLIRRRQPVPEALPFGDHTLVPCRAGGECAWTFRPTS